MGLKEQPFGNKENNRFYLLGEDSNEHGMMRMSKNGAYIDFDIGVIVTESKGDSKKSGIGIMVANFITGVGSEKKDEFTNERMNRLKFRVFIQDIIKR